MKNQVFKIGNSETRVVFSDISRLLDFDHSKTLAVFDENTRKLFPEEIDPVEHILKPGEVSKNWDSVESILSRALESGLARDSLFAGIGGGVICDMTAFAGSVYMRGADIILIPTTLLAMADASLGGKTGIDFLGYKNMIGTFAPAREVRICTDLLFTLPEGEYLNGIGEIFKHGLLRDREILNILKNEYNGVMERKGDVLTDLLERSIQVKGWYVEQDSVEKGIRAHLNLGHTFGHALESVSGFSEVSHGEAVVWGMVKALETGILMGVTPESWLKEVKELAELYSYRLNTPRGINADSLIDAVKKDKKKKGGTVQFVLQKEQGETFLSPVEEDILKQVLDN